MMSRKILNSLMLLNVRYNFLSKSYSSFPPQYVKPIFNKTEQQELYETEEAKALTHVPIKPAFTSDTCSEFYDPVVRKFTNYLMRKGNKTLARRLVEETLENIKIMQLKEYHNASPAEKESIILDPKEILHRAVENCIPVLELRKVMRGGISYQVPIPMNPNRAKFLSMNWLIRAAQVKGDTEKLIDVLAKELIDASKNEGRVIKKKYDLHKQCEANRAYAHYRWL